MKKSVWLIAIVALLLISSPVLGANSFSLGFEIPISYAFNNADDGSKLQADGVPAGILAFLSLPFFNSGVGLESYEVKLDQSGSSSIANTMLDVFYVLPIPVIKIGLGLGYGIAEVKGDFASYYQKTNCYQYFLKLGIPIGTILQVDAGYHVISSQIDIVDSDQALEAGGTLTSLGVSIAF